VYFRLSYDKILFFRKKGDVDIEQSTDELVKNKSRDTNLFYYLSFTNYTNFEGKIYSK